MVGEKMNGFSWKRPVKMTASTGSVPFFLTKSDDACSPTFTYLLLLAIQSEEHANTILSHYL